MECPAFRPFGVADYHRQLTDGLQRAAAESTAELPAEEFLAIDATVAVDIDEFPELQGTVAVGIAGLERRAQLLVLPFHRDAPSRSMSRRISTRPVSGSIKRGD
jgi:hypothetical protein